MSTCCLQMVGYFGSFVPSLLTEGGDVLVLVISKPIFILFERFLIRCFISTQSIIPYFIAVFNSTLFCEPKLRIFT